MDKLLLSRNNGSLWAAYTLNEKVAVMTKEEALERLPDLDGLDQIDLVVLRKKAPNIEDNLLVEAMDVAIKP